MLIITASDSVVRSDRERAIFCRRVERKEGEMEKQCPFAPYHDPEIVYVGTPPPRECSENCGIYREDWGECAFHGPPVKDGEQKP